DDAIEVAFLPQPREPFSDRRAAHSVLGGKTDLGQRRARAVTPLDDAGLEIAIRALDVRGVDGAAAGSGLHKCLLRLSCRAVYRSDPTGCNPSTHFVRSGRAPLLCYPENAFPS